MRQQLQQKLLVFRRMERAHMPQEELLFSYAPGLPQLLPRSRVKGEGSGVINHRQMQNLQQLKKLK